MKISENLRKWRDKKGLSQIEAATTCDVSLAMYQKYETGKNMPGAEAIDGFIRAGINPLWLFTGQGEMLLGERQEGDTEQLQDVEHVQPTGSNYIGKHPFLERTVMHDVIAEMLESIERKGIKLSYDKTAELILLIYDYVVLAEIDSVDEVTKRILSLVEK